MRTDNSWIGACSRRLEASSGGGALNGCVTRGVAVGTSPGGIGGEFVDPSGELVGVEAGRVLAADGAGLATPGGVALGVALC